jgi:hypothetical protein
MEVSFGSRLVSRRCLAFKDFCEDIVYDLRSHYESTRAFSRFSAAQPRMLSIFSFKPDGKVTSYLVIVMQP